MSLDAMFPHDPSPKTREQVIAEFYREMERLRLLKGDSRDELDEFVLLPKSIQPRLTAEDFANAIPARPLIEALLRRPRDTP